MDKKAPIFEENYKRYLQEIESLDFDVVADKLGIKNDKGTLYIPFFNKVIRVDKSGIYNERGERPMYSECVVIAKYLLLAPDIIPPVNQWITYREFKDSAPFAGAFSNNVEQMIVKRFSGKIDKLQEAGEKLGGKVLKNLPFSYELVMKFFALPNFHLLLVYNDEDEEFPAEARVLFPDNGDKILDMECLAISGWLLSDYLYILSGGKGFTIM